MTNRVTNLKLRSGSGSGLGTTKRLFYYSLCITETEGEGPCLENFENIYYPVNLLLDKIINQKLDPRIVFRRFCNY